MSKYFGVLSALLSALIAFAAVPAASVAAPRSAAVSVRTAPAAVFGARIFGRRSPSLSSRYRYGYRTRSPYYRPAYRRSPFHGFGGTILKGLGIAYLFHMLFGIGAGGGSPFGLVILVALIAFVVGRMRRPRRMMY
jgi:predicted lipid-binding transport protein (Tim44 family)